jgi:hypothetical protein
VTTQTIDDPQTTIGELLQLAGTQGVLLQTQGKPRFALIPLDDDVIDFLIERNPRLIGECSQIRERMHKGATSTQQEVDALFGRSPQST